MISLQPSICQESVFGDVQLGVDVVADNLMWGVCKTDPLIKEGASEEEPEVLLRFAPSCSVLLRALSVSTSTVPETKRILQMPQSATLQE